MLLVVSLLAGRAMADETNIHGSISQGFLKTTNFNYLTDDSKEGIYQFNEMNANFSNRISEQFHIGFGLSSRNLGEFGGTEVELNWAYGDYRFKDYLGLRIGRIKMPIGLYNETREMDMFRTCIILPPVYPEAYRDFWSHLDGAGIYGNIQTGPLGTFSYQVTIGTEKVPADGGTALYYNERLSALDAHISRIHVVDTVSSFNLKWETPLPGLELNQSYLDLGTPELTSSFYHPALGDLNGIIYGKDMFITFSSLKYDYNNFSFAAEYFDFEFDSMIITDDGFKLLDSKETKIMGWYVNPTYRFTNWFEMGTYYSEFYPTKQERDTEYLKDLCLSLRFDLNPNWIVKLEGHRLKGIGYVVQSHNPTKDFSSGDYNNEQWSMFAAKVTYNF
jgi:hypothetical protein